jgi:hypothetical protein
MIALGMYRPVEIASICDVSVGAVCYQRDAMGMSPKRRAKEAVRDATTPHNAVPDFRLCFCSGCYERATNGKFCDGHSAPVMAAKVTAGMSDATRRKLTGARA